MDINMWEKLEGRVSEVLFGAFCFYLFYFGVVVINLDAGIQWITVPAVSFVLSLSVLWFYKDKVIVQAYTIAVLACINLCAYSILFHEFTEVFTVFCVAVCMISFYHILAVNYMLLGFSTVYIAVQLICGEEWGSLLRRGSFVTVIIRVLSVYLVQLLLIGLIKRQQAVQELVRQKALEVEKAAQAKEDFLVNMSHEIRTPMNAITGMAELALRNDHLADQDKEYLYHIRTAGEELLCIVNDILDITKIDSGSFELMEEIYEITPMIHDVVNRTQVILGEKQVVLVVDVNPNLPASLRGDGIRIKQILLNLLSHAVKYTEKGTIHFKVGFVPVAGKENRIDLEVSVADTGAGMSKEQLEDLFTKFRQPDNGLDRAKGGSGLELAICRRLIELMQGTLVTKSEPGKGTEFVFTVSQEVIAVNAPVNTDQSAVVQPCLGKQDNAARQKPAKELDQTAFTAPGARILLVDDNKVNLKVAQGLLRPYKMCIETAGSGSQAVEMVQQRIYDLILMDHMMPQMDGVEAAKIIRRLGGTYFGKVPIIALSANAVKGAKEIFLEAGMNDFVAKPIEMQTMDSALRRWLPENKIIMNDRAVSSPEREEHSSASDAGTNPLLWQMEGIDVVVGLKYSGEDAELYREILTDYMDTIEEKANVIEQAVEQGDIETYTIEVHSLKSTSRSIGAVVLSELARELEENGKNKEWGTIVARTPALLSMYRSLYHIIMPYRSVKEEAPQKEPIDNRKMSGLLRQLFDSVSMYDSIRAEELLDELAGYDLGDQWKEYFEAVSETIGRFDYDACLKEITLWRGALQEKMREV